MNNTEQTSENIFEYLMFSSRFSTYQISWDKNVNISRTKRAFDMKQKAFLFQEIKTTFSEGESRTLNITSIPLLFIQVSLSHFLKS